MLEVVTALLQHYKLINKYIGSLVGLSVFFIKLAHILKFNPLVLHDALHSRAYWLDLSCQLISRKGNQDLVASGKSVSLQIDKKIGIFILFEIFCPKARIHV